MRLLVSSNRASDIVAGPEKPFGLVSVRVPDTEKDRLKEGIIEHSQQNSPCVPGSIVPELV